MENDNLPLDHVATAPGQNGLKITPAIRQYWRESAQWALFFAILGFLYLGIVGLMLILAAGSSRGGIIGALFGILILGGLVFVPTWLIYQFSRHVKDGLQHESTLLVALGFRNLRYLYQFAGILIIVLLSLYALAFFLGLLMLASR